jgi:CheY-like chemotaxis protein
VFRVVADPSASKSRVADPAPPAATHAPLPSVARAIVAEPNSAVAAEVLAYLEQWRIKAVHVKDGGETLLRTLRSRPELVIVGDRLPGIAGPELTEIFRRVSDLKGVRIIHVTSIDDPSCPTEFGADVTVQPDGLPEALGGALKRLDIGVPPKATAPRAAAPRQAKRPPADLPTAGRGQPETRQPRARSRPAPRQQAPERPVPPRREPRPRPAESPAPRASRASTPRASSGEGPPADPRVAEALRLARIIVSDIVLYNEDRFDRAVRDGNLMEALQNELTEGRALFQVRIPEEVRAQRDFLLEELESVAAKRSGNAA